MADKYLLRADQELPVTVRFEDRFGNEAEVQGEPEWSSSNSDVVTVEVEGEVAFIVPNKVGSAQVSVRADADMGEGVVDVIGTLDIEVVAGRAFTITLQPGEPIDRDFDDDDEGGTTDTGSTDDEDTTDTTDEEEDVSTNG